MNLTLYNSVLAGKKFIANITKLAQPTWTRSITAQGGYWIGTFEFSDSIPVMTKWFYEYLGHHVDEDNGGKTTWEGLVYSMELTVNGVTRRRTFEDMWNKIFTVDDANNAIVVENVESQTKYGVKQASFTQATDTPQSHRSYSVAKIKECAWPWARVIGIGTNQERKPENKLAVTVCGYAFTMNWRLQTTGTDMVDSLDEWIITMLATDCEFVTTGNIATNPLQVYQTLSDTFNYTIQDNVFMVNTKCVWDVIQMLVEFGDENSNIYRAYVDNDRKFYYEQIATTPKYYMKAGQLYTSPSRNIQAVDPYSVRPAVIRDLDYPAVSSEYNGWLDDARDYYVTEVEVGPNGLTLKTAGYDESELVSAYENYLASLDTGGRGGGGGANRKKGENKNEKIGLKPKGGIGTGKP